MNKLRTLEIIDYLKVCRYCSIAELMTRFKVSPATIRRDIAELLEARRIRKIHGGVALAEEDAPAAVSLPPTLADHYLKRLSEHSAAKNRIAGDAARLIADGDTIFIDSSTTGYYLGRRLQQSDFAELTIVTNSVLIMQEFSSFPAHYSLVGLGGNFDLQLNALLGQATLRELGRLHIGKSFISAIGITAAGISSRHENLAIFLQQVIAASRKNYLLIDSAKFNREGLFPVAPLHALTDIISEEPLPDFLRVN